MTSLINYHVLVGVAPLDSVTPLSIDARGQVQYVLSKVLIQNLEPAVEAIPLLHGCFLELLVVLLDLVQGLPALDLVVQLPLVW